MTATAGDALSQVLLKGPAEAFCGRIRRRKFGGHPSHRRPRRSRAWHLFLRLPHGSHDRPPGTAACSKPFRLRHYLRKARRDRRWLCLQV